MTIAAPAGNDLAVRGGKPDAVTNVCIDISPVFIKGAPDGLLSEAAEQVRRVEAKSYTLLRGPNYVWLRNPDNLPERHCDALDGLPFTHLKATRASQIRLALPKLSYQLSDEAAIEYCKTRCFRAIHSRLEPVIDAARTVGHHWDGISQ